MSGKPRCHDCGAGDAGCVRGCGERQGMNDQMISAWRTLQGHPDAIDQRWGVNSKRLELTRRGGTVRGRVKPVVNAMMKRLIEAIAVLLDGFMERRR